MNLLRDGDGKFTTLAKFTSRTAVKLVFITFTLYVISLGILKINAWSQLHTLNKPVILLVGKEANNGEAVLTVKTQTVVQDRKPIEVLSPVVKSVMEDPVEKDLTDNEKKLLDTFGLVNFRVARAVAKCESGMNPNAVNWETRDLGFMQINWPTWEKPVKDKFGYKIADMFDIDKNLEVAKWIWDRDGDGQGSWSPWVSTQTQCFQENL